MLLLVINLVSQFTKPKLSQSNQNEICFNRLINRLANFCFIGFLTHFVSWKPSHPNRCDLLIHN